MRVSLPGEATYGQDLAGTRRYALSYKSLTDPITEDQYRAHPAAVAGLGPEGAP